MKNFAWIMIGIVAALAGVLLLLPEPGDETPEPESTAERTFITGARVFDGKKFIDDATLLIADSRVEALGSDLSVDDGAEIFDASGKTILPGLIDAHVHGFGTARADALRFGVTTMLDMFRPPFDFAQTHAERESLAPTDRADLYSAGFLATAAGGHGTQYGIDVPTVVGPEQAADWVAARKDEGSDWIKIIIEPGWGKRILPMLDAVTVQALVVAAHANDLLAVAHISTYDDALMAIEAGIDGLVHLFADRRLDQAFIDAALAADIFVVPTTPVLVGMYGHDDTDWITTHPVLGPRLTAAQRDSLATRFLQQEADDSGWANVQANVRALHEAGIPILAGSDAPNPATTYGASLHHALRLLVAAGLQPIDALRAASSVPAREFGLDNRGCLQPGCRADLLLVNGNPLTDIVATAMIDAVWKNGQRVEFDMPAQLPETAPATAAVAGEQNMLANPARWMAAADDYMGGASSAAIAWKQDNGAQQAGDKADTSQALAITGAVADGYPFPYAGAMWFASDTPMQPEDYSGYARLLLHIDSAPGEYQALFFSGASQAAQPVPVPITVGQINRIELGEVDGLDLTRLRAIGVFASGSARAVDFTIRAASIE